MNITITNGTLTQVQETLTAATGYNLPSDIAVTGATKAYDSTTGVVTLTNPTSTVSITASAEAITYPITTSLTNLTATGATSIDYGGTATVTLSAATGYALPVSITVSGPVVSEYNIITGVITLSEPLGAFGITATGLTQEERFDSIANGLVDAINAKANTSGEKTLAGALVAAYGIETLPRITLTLSQVISQDPLTVQLTQEQIDIIESVDYFCGLILDVSAFDQGTPTLVRNGSNVFYNVLGDTLNVFTYDDEDGTVTYTTETVGGGSLPTITITASQIISQDPLTIQLTNAQINVIENVDAMGVLMVDATEFGYDDILPFVYDGQGHYAIASWYSWYGYKIVSGRISVLFYNDVEGTLIQSESNDLIDTTDATATAEDILEGKTAYVDGEKITGAIPSKAAATYTPTTSNQTIAAGQYLAGAQTIAGDANLVAGNIKRGVSIFGVTGSLDISGETTYFPIKKGTYKLSSSTVYIERYFSSTPVAGSSGGYNLDKISWNSTVSISKPLYYYNGQTATPVPTGVIYAVSSYGISSESAIQSIDYDATNLKVTGHLTSLITDSGGSAKSTSHSFTWLCYKDGSYYRTVFVLDCDSEYQILASIGGWSHSSHGGGHTPYSPSWSEKSATTSTSWYSMYSASESTTLHKPMLAVIGGGNDNTFSCSGAIFAYSTRNNVSIFL